MSYQSDDDALRAALGGDTSAFRWLVEKEQQRIYMIIYAQVRDHTVAKRLTEETFVKAYQNLDRCPRGFSIWLQRIAMNLCIDHQRRTQYEAQDSFVARDEDTQGQAHQSDTNQIARLLSMMEQLPHAQREVIQLRKIDDLTYREIAERLGIPEGHVMSRLFYARKALRAALKTSE